MDINSSIDVNQEFYMNVITNRLFINFLKLHNISRYRDLRFISSMTFAYASSIFASAFLERFLVLKCRLPWFLWENIELLATLKPTTLTFLIIVESPKFFHTCSRSSPAPARRLTRLYVIEYFIFGWPGWVRKNPLLSKYWSMRTLTNSWVDDVRVY